MKSSRMRFRDPTRIFSKRLRLKSPRRILGLQKTKLKEVQHDASYCVGPESGRFERQGEAYPDTHFKQLVHTIDLPSFVRTEWYPWPGLLFHDSYGVIRESGTLLEREEAPGRIRWYLYSSMTLVVISWLSKYYCVWTRVLEMNEMLYLRENCLSVNQKNPYQFDHFKNLKAASQLSIHPSS
ncbi:hypothetical protein BDZ45DRAFT_495289 [Acephala macrosclerotiorum]|nr:hypothetical protein BDZ45DRAFT_495289 [Acephala macrosclerotiorum]